jgi:phosphonate transport system substrate-binding protein
VLGLAAGEIEVAALSNDKIQSMLADGEIQEADFRTIHESEVIPRFSIGHVYNLKPELAAKISNAIVEFENKSGPMDENGQRMRFFPTNYQQDFVFMREIDECFDPRLSPNPSKSEAAAEETATSPQA